MPHETSPTSPVTALHDLARVALYAAMTGAGAFIHLPLGPLHISFQTMVVILAGFALGPRKGALAMGLYLLCGLIGLPMFGQGKAGPIAFLGPTAGYFLIFVPAAALAGLAEKFGKTPVKRGFSRFIFGLAATAFILLAGTAVLRLGFIGSWRQAFLIGFLPFVVGDLLKLAAAVAIREALPDPAGKSPAAGTMAPGSGERE